MNNLEIDWSTFTRRIYIEASLKEVYNAWALPKLIATWFLKQATYTNKEGVVKNANDLILPGDQYEWKWHNWDEVGKGCIYEANGVDYLKFDFAGGIVEVFLNEEKGKTHLRLVQSDIATDDQHKLNIFNGCSLGWSFWMVNLKAWLEHGILLNEREAIPESNHQVVNC